MNKRQRWFRAMVVKRRGPVHCITRDGERVTIFVGVHELGVPIPIAVRRLVRPRKTVELIP